MFVHWIDWSFTTYISGIIVILQSFPMFTRCLFKHVEANCHTFLWSPENGQSNLCSFVSKWKNVDKLRRKFLIHMRKGRGIRVGDIEYTYIPASDYSLYMNYMYMNFHSHSARSICICLRVTTTYGVQTYVHGSRNFFFGLFLMPYYWFGKPE